MLRKIMAAQQLSAREPASSCLNEVRRIQNLRRMQWYYAKAGQQAGPVSETELQQLARNGEIRPDTLVWREGLANWQPYSSVAPPSVSPLAPIAPPANAVPFCAECNRAFPPTEMLRYENVYVCGACKPTFFQRLREGAGPAGGALWRSGRFLVIRKDSALPDRCVKCNEPAHGWKLTRKLFWHSPYVYLLIPVGVLIYALIATLIGKRARVELGVCPEHRRTRTRDIWISVLIFLLSIASFVGAAVLENVWFVGIGLALLFTSLVYASIRTALVTPKRIDDQHAWLKGVSSDYMSTLPEWSGPGPR